MRALKIVFAAAVAVVAVGCNAGQPRIYQLAIDGSPLTSLPPTCYLGNTINPIRDIQTNLRSDQRWTIWDGVEGKQYLDIGTYAVQLGGADPVTGMGMIEGSDRSFSGQKITQGLPGQPGKDPNYTFTKTLSLVVTFDDLGASPKGTIAASSKYTCTNCGTNNDNKVADCSANLPFVSRRIDASNMNIYQP
jgi:hypothetical protein